MTKHDIKIRKNLLKKGSIRQYKDFHKFEKMYVKKKRKHHTLKWLVILIALIILLSVYFLLGSFEESTLPLKREIEFNNTAQIL